MKILPSALLLTGSLVTGSLVTGSPVTGPPEILAAAPAARLLANPGFESGLASWTPDDPAAVTVVPSPVRTGAGAVRIVDTGDDRGLGVRSAALAVLPGEDVTATVWTRQQIAGAGGWLYLEFRRPDGSRSTPVVSVPATASTSWQQLTVTGTAPDDAVTATVLAYSAWADVGTTYWDDAAVSALPPPLRKLPNAGFEERRNPETPTQWTSTPQSVRLLRGTQAHGGTGYAQIDDRDQTTEVSALSDAVPVEVGETVTTTAWAQRRSGSGAALSVEFRDAAGAWVGPAHTTTVPAGTAWQPVRVTATAPAAAAALRVRLLAPATTLSQTWWDDVALRSSADDPYDPALATDAPVLFVGDQRVESSTGVTRVVHPGTKAGAAGKVFSGIGGWDANPRVTGTVLAGEEGEAPYTMWYTTTNGVTGRAISTDGVSWTRDGRTTPVLTEGPQGLVRNPAWTAGSGLPRYFLMVDVNVKPDPPFYIGRQSTDGITWTDIPGARGIPGFDVANTTWDPVTRRFVTMLKNQLRAPFGPRTTWVSTSTDFRTWTAPRPAFAADPLDDARIPAGAGRLGTTAWSEVYGMPAIRHGDQYLGVPWIFDIVYSPKALTDPGPDKGRSHLGLAASRDLVNWSRPNRTPLVTPGEAGTWDHGFQMSSSSFVHVREPDGRLRTRLYYSSFAGEHTCDDADILAGECTVGYGNSHVGMVSWPADRFASFRAAGAAVVTTRPLATAGRILAVNYRPGSALRVEVLGADGRALPGYALTDATPVTSDALAPGARVSWGTRTALPAGPVRLRFHLTGGDLYGFTLN